MNGLVALALLALLLPAAPAPPSWDLLLRGSRIVDGSGNPWFEGILSDPHLRSKITQGITTELTGEGSSVAPMTPRNWGKNDRGADRHRGGAGARHRHDGRHPSLPGMHADITVFDPARVIDRATFEDPHRFSEGIIHVLVNGVAVIEAGKITGELPGRVLKGRGFRGP